MPDRREKVVTKPESRSVTQPSHEEIALRAYNLYLERGATDGDDLADWFGAESELLADYAASPRAVKAARA